MQKNHTNFTIYTTPLANQTEPLYIAQHVHLLHVRRGTTATWLEGYGKCLRVFYVNHGLKLAIARLKNAQTHWLTVHDCPQLVLMLGRSRWQIIGINFYEFGAFVPQNAAVVRLFCGQTSHFYNRVAA